MSQIDLHVVIMAGLLVLVLRQPAEAAAEPIPASLIPPPPGKLEFNFPNEPRPGAFRTDLHFSGEIGTSSLSPAPTLTWRFSWTLPSGELTYGAPISFHLVPMEFTHVEKFESIAGCPSNVGLVFTTDDPQGSGIWYGTLDHTCAVPLPEPGSVAILALAAGCFSIGKGRGASKHPTTPSAYPIASAPSH